MKSRAVGGAAWAAGLIVALAAAGCGGASEEHAAVDDALATKVITCDEIEGTTCFLTSEADACAAVGHASPEMSEVSGALGTAVAQGRFPGDDGIAVPIHSIVLRNGKTPFSIGGVGASPTQSSNQDPTKHPEVVSLWHGDEQLGNILLAAYCNKGGLGAVGYPITGVGAPVDRAASVIDSGPASEEIVFSQWFERQRIEVHYRSYASGNVRWYTAGGFLGVEYEAKRFGNCGGDADCERAVAEMDAPSPALHPHCVAGDLDAKTNRPICERMGPPLGNHSSGDDPNSFFDVGFDTYFATHGGVSQLGHPIGYPFELVEPDGHGGRTTYYAQFFQRALLTTRGGPHPLVEGYLLGDALAH